MLLTRLLIHGYLPQELMDTILIPVVKNKGGNVSDSGFYRPIAIANVVSKVLESILLSRCEEFLITTDNQFGFKPHHSTDMCIYTLKEVLHFYRSRGSPVFLCSLDASKAFDRVNHKIGRASCRERV